jgi:DNA (cytosine-5)-methyltransferase 1
MLSPVKRYKRKALLKGIPNIKDRPVAIDLFAGAGGLSEGFSQAGFFIALAVENDRYAVDTYVHNHCLHKSRFRTQVLDHDISKLDFDWIADYFRIGLGRTPDVVIGGSPCQGFSRSNMRTRNILNPDNRLAKYFILAVRILRPRFAVLENVADVESFDQGRFVDSLIRGFRRIGYEVNYAILNALDFGIPQRRRRIFIVAASDGISTELPNTVGSHGTGVTVWDAISDLPALQNGNNIDVLPYRVNIKPSAYQLAMRTRANDFVRNNLVTRNSELVLRRYAHIPQGGNWENIPDELMTNYRDKTRCHHWIYRRLSENEPSVAITHYRKSMLIHPREDRGLSVREAARIQSFPDHYVFQGPLGSQQQQVANAVPPLLARAVARQVKRNLGL